MQGESPITSKQTAASAIKSGAAFPTIIGVAAIVFALDQATKFLVVQNIPLSESWSISPIFARLFKFTYITNTGAAFGMFPQLGNIFTVVAIIVIIGIVFFHHFLPIGSIWVRLSIGLQLGGAMGNLVDRVLRGFVVDFVDIGFWPIFNIADISIVVGVTILTFCLWDEENSANSRQDVVGLSEKGGL